MSAEKKTSEKTSTSTTESKEEKKVVAAEATEGAKADVTETAEATEEAAADEKKEKAPPKEASFANPAAKVAPVEEPAEEAEDDDDTLRRLLSNADDVVDDVEQRVLNKIDQREQVRAKAQDAWNFFYQENPELSGHKDLVDLVRRQVLEEDRQAETRLSWEDGAKRVAKKAKALLNSIRSNNREEVDTEEASSGTVVSSSGNPTPIQVKKPGKKSFIDQMKSHRAR